MPWRPRWARRRECPASQGATAPLVAATRADDRRSSSSGSSPPSALKVGAVPYNAPRSQKTARASGEHPGVLKEPEVQLEAATVLPVPPLLVVASLAGTKYLLKCALRKRQKEEEEERRRKEKKEHEELMKRAQSVIDDAASLSSSSRKRRKKKWRKRKLPKSGCRLFLPGCGLPCDHASDPVHPRTLGLPVVAQRQVPTVHALQLQVQFLDTVLDMPVVVLRQVPGSMVQKTVVLPQLQSIDGRRHSLSFRRGSSPWSLRPWRVPSCVWTVRSMPLLCRSCRSLAIPSRHRGRSPWSL